MPSIDYSGRFHAYAVSTSKGSRGAVGFPIKASSLHAARNFANREILKLLPGWTYGTVTIRKDGKQVASHVMRRQDTSQPERNGMTKPRCDKCRFWCQYGGGDLGQCRIDPPVLIDVDGEFETMFPATEDNEWCGKFQPGESGQGRGFHRYDDATRD